MKIYTGFGDKGKTSLLNGVVDKDSLVVEAYGTIDELNSFVGLINHYISSEDLFRIQKTLFLIGAELAGDKHSLSNEEIFWLESKIDSIELPSLSNFILPGGSKISALFHIARTVCRRAERRAVTLNKTNKINANILVYLNRLSDYLFVLARYYNLKEGVDEKVWSL